MIFTRHSFERYRQFHMLDNPLATDEDARRILERFGPTAIETKARTKLGDPIWRIEELGLELVARPDNGTVVCVTILPPVRFRGLTPLQAERVEDSMRSKAALGAQIEREIERERTNLRARAPTTGTKPADADAEKRRCQRLEALNTPAKIAQAEQLTLGSILKTMRTQICADQQATNVRQALRIAVRQLRSSTSPEAHEALAEIADIDPGLISEEFAFGTALTEVQK